MSASKFDPCPDHKAIREALGYCLETGGVGFTVASADLRALLADLDAMRGALERISCAAKATVCNPEWIAAHADAALKGAEA